MNSNNQNSEFLLFQELAQLEKKLDKIEEMEKRLDKVEQAILSWVCLSFIMFASKFFILNLFY